MEGFVWCPHCGSPHGLGAPSCPKTGQPLVRGHAAARGLPRGTVVGKRYKLRAWIGHDVLVQLYEAKIQGLGRRVLLEMIDGGDGSADERAAELAAMEREANAASMVDHPNVAEVVDFARTGVGEGFLVRPWASRAKLATSLRAAGALDVADAGDLIAQILSGVHALHRAGVVHRDLGSHVIWLAERAGCRAIPRIAGLGRCSGPGIDPPRGLPPGVHYASPELLRGGDVGEASDLFACGVILFEMLTGRRPFEGKSEEEVQLSILRDQRPRASKLRPGLAEAWGEVLDRALHPDPARRFRSAVEFQRALPTYVRGAARLRSVASDADGETEIADMSPKSTSFTSRPPSSRRGSRCDPYIGRRLANKYRMDSLLGSGSAGAVYKATHVDLRRLVAVKVLHDWNRSSTQFVERFKAEALAASKLDHPHLTRVLDCGQEPDGTLYLVMEYVEGKSLDAVIAEEGRLPPARAVGIALQIASSLAVAHDAGIVHRDVKPENIILLHEEDDDGKTSDHAKVCDFGLAKLHDRERDEGAEELTRAGLLLGSPAYMAPEQIRGLPCDARADVYAAGVTLFELLTGRLPHEAESLEELFRKKLCEPPARPSSVVDGEIDPLLEDVVMHALEASPEKRHASARELRNELAAALEYLRAPPSSSNEVTVSVWPTTPPEPSDAGE